LFLVQTQNIRFGQKLQPLSFLFRTLLIWSQPFRSS
jgi:hypothetical protein